MAGDSWQCMLAEGDAALGPCERSLFDHGISLYAQIHNLDARLGRCDDGGQRICESKPWRIGLRQTDKARTMSRHKGRVQCRSNARSWSSFAAVSAAWPMQQMLNLLFAISAAALYFVTTSDCIPCTRLHHHSGFRAAGSGSTCRGWCMHHHSSRLQLEHLRSFRRYKNTSNDVCLTLLRSISSCSDPLSDMMATQRVRSSLWRRCLLPCADYSSMISITAISIQERKAGKIATSHCGVAADEVRICDVCLPRWHAGSCANLKCALNSHTHTPLLSHAPFCLTCYLSGREHCTCTTQDLHSGCRRIRGVHSRLTSPHSAPMPDRLIRGRCPG